MEKLPRTDIPPRATFSFGESVGNVFADVKARTVTFRFDVGNAQMIREESGKGLTFLREVLRPDSARQLWSEAIIEYLTGRSKRFFGKLRFLAIRVMGLRPTYLSSVVSGKSVLVTMPEKGSIVLEVVLQVNPDADFEAIYLQVIEHLKSHDRREMEVFVTDANESHRRRPRRENVTRRQSPERHGTTPTLQEETNASTAPEAADQNTPPDSPAAPQAANAILRKYMRRARKYTK